MSMRPNTPVRGMPSGAPMTASASSTVSPRASASPIAVPIQKTPRRLAMKPGVSLQRTTVFPSRRSQTCSIASTASGRASSPATISSRRMYRGGLKKWVITRSRTRPAGAPSSSSRSGIVDVFDDTIDPGFLTESRRA